MTSTTSTVTSITTVPLITRSMFPSTATATTRVVFLVDVDTMTVLIRSWCALNCRGGELLATIHGTRGGRPTRIAGPLGPWALAGVDQGDQVDRLLDQLDQVDHVEVGRRGRGREVEVVVEHIAADVSGRGSGRSW